MTPTMFRACACPSAWGCDPLETDRKIKIKMMATAPGKCFLVTGPPLSPAEVSHNFSPESIRWPTVGKYKVDIASFEALALPELQIKEDTDLFIIDEVGKMELFSSSFFPAVLKVLESNIPLLASIPIPKFGRDIPAVARLRDHPGAKIFTLSPSNSDAVKEQIYTQLVDSE
ncbi:uncharacterized protein LOC18099100 isoform X4 [Populus trichocarpa]|uniref:uncharacterized protein LOC18099100 isoform X4 n=2 Tax=Populus trichocarpa TaxID=3694 RepID=UPI0022777CB9|nr:uncharacterized protein LOC18099100 isoform X4 [Populus trichocarpa]